MSNRFDGHSVFAGRFCGLIALVGVALICSTSSAQFINGNQIQQIGGVLIDAQGVVANTNNQLSAQLRKEILKQVENAQGKMADKAGLRAVSLKGLHAEVKNAIDNEKQIPASALYLAGLQRIQYVIVDPEKKDILLVGPAEGWTVNKQGNVVGKTTGLPVLHLEDLMIALRSSDNARQGEGISVSINPTEEGNKKLAAFFKRFQRSGQKFNTKAATMVEQVMGPQDVTLTGVDTHSRFAQVLVAADYQMKRLSMGFEKSPVKNMPSFLALCQKTDTNARSMTPRFWMECNYKPVKHSKDKLAFEIEGSVKAMTESEVVEKSGKRVGTGRQNKLAKKWADSMTKNFDKLKKAEPVFAELQNIMDLSVVAALIQSERLLKKADMSLNYFTDKKKLDVPELNVPKSVPTQCSFCSLSRSTLVTASGGVQVDSWAVIENLKQDKAVSTARTTILAKAGDQWWWNVN